TLRDSYFFYCSGHRRHLHSFPTRRSSDLPARCKRTAVDDPLWSIIACNRWIGSIKLWSFPTASDWASDNAICRRLVNLSILMDVPQSLIYPHSAQGLTFTKYVGARILESSVPLSGTRAALKARDATRSDWPSGPFGRHGGRKKSVGNHCRCKSSRH